MASRSSSSLTNPARSWHTWTRPKHSPIKPSAPGTSPQGHTNEHLGSTPQASGPARLPCSWCRCPRRGPRTARSGSTGGGCRRCAPAGPAAALPPAALPVGSGWARRGRTRRGGGWGRRICAHAAACGVYGGRGGCAVAFLLAPRPPAGWWWGRTAAACCVADWPRRTARSGPPGI
jgi:hypothetical protein